MKQKTQFLRDMQFVGQVNISPTHSFLICVLQKAVKSLITCPWTGESVRALLRPSSRWRPAKEKDRLTREAAEESLMGNDEIDIWKLKLNGQLPHSRHQPLLAVNGTSRPAEANC